MKTKELIEILQLFSKEEKELPIKIASYGDSVNITHVINDSKELVLEFERMAT